MYKRQILGYPVITAGEYAHRGSFVQLAGSEDAAAQQVFTLEDKVCLLYTSRCV